MMDAGSFHEVASTRTSLRRFYLTAVISQVIGITAIILIAVLYGQYRGGFAWTSNPSKEFNWHPVFMTVGMIFLYGDAILVYRVFPDVKKIQVKILHAWLLALSLIFASVGLKAVFDSHNLANPPMSNLNSIHSWIGLTTVVLFGLQWICGFLSFLFPKLSDNFRKAYMPSHKFWGKVIFMLAVGAVLMGITEDSIYSGVYSKSELKYQRNIVNSFGICVVAFAIIVMYLVNHFGYQRPPDNDLEHAPLTE